MARPPDARLDAVRRFNRVYTRRIGVLQKGMLGSPFSLAELRVLYELAHRERPVAADLVRELGLDAGYLSRILRRFQGDGLIEREPSEHDGRQQRLRLTDAGRAAFAPLETRQRDEVGAVTVGGERVALEGDAGVGRGDQAGAQDLGELRDQARISAHALRASSRPSRCRVPAGRRRAARTGRP